MPRGVYDRTKKKNADLLASYHQNGADDHHKNERIRWTDAELKLIADEWVLLRVANPFEPPGNLFEQAQRKVLDGSRQRSVPGVQAYKPLAIAIMKAWKEFLDKPAVVEKAPGPEVQIVTVEVPRRLTAAEMLAMVDEPALEGLLAAKRLERESQFHQLLASIIAQPGAAKPTIAPFVPRMEIFDSGQKKHPRVAIVGAPSSEHELILGEIKAAELPALIRFPDGKDKETVARCDYAIICRDKNSMTTAADSDRAIGELGRNRVILLDGGYNGPRVLQAVRDIMSRK